MVRWSQVLAPYVTEAELATEIEAALEEYEGGGGPPEVYYVGNDDETVGSVAFVVPSGLYFNKFTLTEGAVVLGCESYVGLHEDNVPGQVWYGILSHSTDQPGSLLWAGGGPVDMVLLDNDGGTAARWMGFGGGGPYLPAGDYWLETYWHDGAGLKLGTVADEAGDNESGTSTTAGWLYEKGSSSYSWSESTTLFLNRVLVMPVTLG
jgi:hypothetical protein